MQQVTSLKQIEAFINKNEEREEYTKKMLQKDIIEKLKKSEKEIEKGEGIVSDEAFKELRLKYEY